MTEALHQRPVQKWVIIYHRQTQTHIVRTEERYYVFLLKNSASYWTRHQLCFCPRNTEESCDGLGVVTYCKVDQIAAMQPLTFSALVPNLSVLGALF